MTVKRKSSSSASDSTRRKSAASSRKKEGSPATKRKVRSSPAKAAGKRASKATAAIRPVRAKTARKSAPVKSSNVLPHQPKPLPTPSVVGVVEHALGEMKAANVKVLDVHELTDIADTLVIASGNSDRHVRAIADRVIEEAKKSGFRPMGVEGERDGEWVLVDLQDVIVHIMLPRVREFYRLESLWDVSAARREVVQSA